MHLMNVGGVVTLAFGHGSSNHNPHPLPLPLPLPLPHHPMSRSCLCKAQLNAQLVETIRKSRCIKTLNDRKCHSCMFACCCAGALLIACLHDSIPDALLLHQDGPEAATPASPGTIPEQDGQSPEQPQLARKPPQIWERGPQGTSTLSPGHSLSRLSPGPILSRLSPLRCALSRVHLFY